nr:hypothetical protein CFP56_09502 [Quercus suber]
MTAGAVWTYRPGDSSRPVCRRLSVLWTAARCDCCCSPSPARATDVVPPCLVHRTTSWTARGGGLSLELPGEHPIGLEVVRSSGEVGT